MPQPEYSPLARLVLFIVCLSIAGSLAAGVYYYAVDLPAQKSLTPPSNANMANWRAFYTSCIHGCYGVPGGFVSCENTCSETAYALYCTGRDVCD